MRGILAGCIIVVVALAGCTVRYSARERTSAPGSTTASQVSVTGGSPLGNAIIVGVMVADGMHYYGLGPNGKTSVRTREIVHTRIVNGEEFARPVDPSAGNLLCR